jgi:hypothetical protein
MDGSRFDGLTRKLANGMSRRQTLQGLTGGTLAGLLAHLGLEEAMAACVKLGQKGCKGPKNKKCCKGATCKGGSKSNTGKCVCKGGLTKCGAKCVNTQTNEEHCGGCNNTPCGDATCEQGSCECPENLTWCGPACVDTETDNAHCGGCDQPCGGTGTCDQGTCVSPEGCRAGDSPCIDRVTCAEQANVVCYCKTDVHGAPRCSSGWGFCSSCTNNADCGPDRACYPIDGPGCDCDDFPNYCGRAVCDSGT